MSQTKKVLDYNRCCSTSTWGVKQRMTTEVKKVRKRNDCKHSKWNAAKGY